MEIKDFRSVRISLASPRTILSWSYGEVTKPETINYRRLRPEKDGLFCEAIFGPTKDWQCYCGKYKKIRFKGITCDKCGVEVTRSTVRRERMGHIDLASPVAHIWYTRRVPSYLGLLLDISRRNLDRVLYFAQYIITRVDEDARRKTIRRINEEGAREIKRLKDTCEERIQEIKEHEEEEIEKLRAVRDSTHERLEEKLATVTDEVMSQASDLQKGLNKRMGKKVRKALTFEPTDTVVVEVGETVGRRHLKLLTELVQSEIEKIESSIREEQANNQTLIEAEEDRLRYVTKKEIDKLRKELEEEIEKVEAANDAILDELRSFKVLQFLNEVRYRELTEKWGDIIEANMGAEALYTVVKDIDLDTLAEELRAEIRQTRSKQRRKKATKRLQVVEALRKSGNRPEWMILTVLPVIPPDLRPMVQLDGGRFATSDLNDLYRRVINRNNRLKRLLDLGAPDVIVRNEKRMLQEAVDSLIDNSRRGKAISLRGKRKLKSLSDMLKGKQGRFRRNLLGKRVDYSGRSVIVIGPHLKLHQCGLPKRMALELFRPFVVNKLVEYNFAHNVKGAKRIIERMKPEVWEVLEEIIKDYPVLLNRAPTLHRLGIQAFQPVLVEGDAIQIHPLVCAAFNADFDGDQMAVHIPLSEAAKREAKELMLSRHNLLLPASGEPVVGPTKDMVLGCYYLTMQKPRQKGEGKVFASMEEVALAYDLGQVDLHAKIKVHTHTRYTINGKRYAGGRRVKRLVGTTVGQVIFNEILPEELRFVNKVMDKGKLKELVSECYYRLGLERTANFVDRIKELGFRYATRSGLTIAMDDITVPGVKAFILNEISDRVNEVEQQFRRGLITEEEKYVKTVELWSMAVDDVTDAVAHALDPYGSIYVMATSGATKGGFQPIRQLAGMRGLMADPAGRIIALPIRSNFREGLTALEYFISTHGARKGLADTALRTADAGYLTRRLVDVAQDVIVNDEDCGTKGGIWLSEAEEKGVGGSLQERILGRIAAANVTRPKSRKILVREGEMIEEEQAAKIIAAGVEKVRVRSPLTCQLRYGICAKCYGRDLARGGLVKVGEAVGIIAAQSIGEPGTQLTLRTFHTGGVAGEADITQGLPRVQELFEARAPKGQAIICDIDGVVEIVRDGDQRTLKVVHSEMLRDEYKVPGNYAILVEDGDEVEEGASIAKRGDKWIKATKAGRVERQDRSIAVLREKREVREYEVPPTARLRVEGNQRVQAGQQLTEGALNPHKVLQILGRDAVQLYLLEEVQKVYRSQGVNINDKHIEIILRQMLRKVKVRQAGDSLYLMGELVDGIEFAEKNAELRDAGMQTGSAQPILLGITKAALNTESFLSASSFQHTINVLASAAIEGKRDDLHGLKENVIIGKLIPAGTGFRNKKETEEPEMLTVDESGDPEAIQEEQSSQE